MKFCFPGFPFRFFIILYCFFIFLLFIIIVIISSFITISLKLFFILLHFLFHFTLFFLVEIADIRFSDFNIILCAINSDLIIIIIRRIFSLRILQHFLISYLGMVINIMNCFILTNKIRKNSRIR